MEEELSPELSVETATKIVPETKETESSFDNLPRYEDLMKSENAVAENVETQTTPSVDTNIVTQDRVFAKKKDETKIYVKKRLKIITSIYISVVALLLGFVGVNIATLAILNKDIDSKTKTIQESQSKLVEMQQADLPSATGEDIVITINEPRDYSDDTKELTFLDKLTILFRNIFS